MVRNPCEKEDKGCSLCCFLSCYVLLQIVYYYFYLDLAYVKDYEVVLKEAAEDNGYVFDEDS